MENSDITVGSSVKIITKNYSEDIFSNGIWRELDGEYVVVSVNPPEGYPEGEEYRIGLHIPGCNGTICFKDSDLELVKKMEKPFEKTNAGYLKDKLNLELKAAKMLAAAIWGTEQFLNSGIEIPPQAIRDTLGQTYYEMAAELGTVKSIKKWADTVLDLYGFRSAVIDSETGGLNPLTDRVIMIGISVNGKYEKIYSENEKEMLKTFWKRIEELRVGKLIGFNTDFDWTFIKLRSLKHGLKIEYFSKYEGRMDLRHILNSNPRAKGKLTEYSDCFGIDLPGDDIDGKDVPPLWEKYLKDRDLKDLKKIEEHLQLDVLRTEAIWKKLKECELI